MSCFHVCGGIHWALVHNGPSVRSLCMVLRGSPLGGRLMPSLQIEANFSLHRDLLELQI